MKCKHCNTTLAQNAKYCHQCGGFVKTERITIKNLWKDFAKDFFGYDNRFIFTIKQMMTRPQIVLEEYLIGVRKKYIKPASLLAISATIFVLLVTIFDGQLEVINNEQYKLYYGKEFVDQLNQGKIDQSDSRMAAIEGGNKTGGLMMKYFSLATFLLIPVYAFISFLTYRKPFNYAEHIILNAYLQGFSFLISSIFFVLSLVQPALYYFYFLIIIIYYWYAMSKLHNHGIGKAIWHFIKFTFFLLLPFLVAVLIGSAIVLYWRFKSG